MYDIIFSPTAFKQLQKLKNDVQDRIIAALERIRIRPERHLKKLVGDPSYRLRVGAYRIIVDLDREELLILVIKVGHRRSVYK